MRIQVDVYRDRLTDIQFGVFCIAGVTATLIMGYLLVGLKDKICQIKSKLIKAILYYITIIMLILDPVYLCLLSGCFGGGDLNGILYLMPQAYILCVLTSEPIPSPTHHAKNPSSIPSVLHDTFLL